ncbi:hypothetical protein JYG30_04065 [Fibrella sp. USSR17]
MNDSFTNVPDWAVAMIGRLFNAVEEEAPLRKADRLRLVKAISQLDQHPQVPDEPCMVSFRVDDLSFTLAYTPYKVELSAYQSIDTGFGYDHEQPYNFRYEQDGYVETHGDPDQFEAHFLTMLESAISVSTSDEE